MHSIHGGAILIDLAWLEGGCRMDYCFEVTTGEGGRGLPESRGANPLQTPPDTTCFSTHTRLRYHNHNHIVLLLWSLDISTTTLSLITTLSKKYHHLE